MTIALIDADIVAYRCAASCQKKEVVTDDLPVAIQRVDDLMHRIIIDTDATLHKAYLTGSNNYRLKYNPEYKANRKDKVKPNWLEQCREHLVLNWGAKVTDGNEADDELGINQTDDTVICSIDKDLLMIPGHHYNFVKLHHSHITPTDGIFNFYWQLIMGDGSDNIFGYDGKARAAIPNFLQSAYHEMQVLAQGDEKELYNYVAEKYGDTERMLMNGICLWIQREVDQLWTPPQSLSSEAI